ncbi:TonB family protein [Myxococcus sp. AM011]|uniref:energy transducer TonB n=1 Tax=Myxococcus sp. AM011 TaxID=2745200 RepID=UPI0015961E99|nr:energy transducer TonB [Myxococcus sp. AM011]NVJ24450.1 TonB family protein [Myxococcus sp. AM011]
MILSFDTPSVEGGPPAERSAESSGRLFRLGESSEREGLWVRWGWALVAAAVVHVGGVAVGLALPARAQKAPVEEEPELVFLSFAPPPPAPGGPSRPASAERASRQARPRMSRPVMAPRALVPPAPKPEVVEPTPPEETPAAPEPTSEPEASAEAASTDTSAPSVPGGVAGGVAGGTQGGIVGAPGGMGEAVGLGQVLRPPSVLKQLTPEYPRRARVDGVQGLVLVRIIVGTDGEVETEHTRIIRSIPMLDAAAIAAVNRWRFSPAIGRHGKAVRVILELPVQFSLK